MRLMSRSWWSWLCGSKTKKIVFFLIRLLLIKTWIQVSGQSNPWACSWLTVASINKCMSFMPIWMIKPTVSTSKKPTRRSIPTRSSSSISVHYLDNIYLEWLRIKYKKIEKLLNSYKNKKWKFVDFNINQN